MIRFPGYLIFFSQAVVVTFFSCHGPDKPGLSNESPIGFQDPPTEIPALQPAKVSDGDPSFVVMQDTVSLFGPHSITRQVLQDKNGDIWLATWEGIIRYDGEYFTNVTLEEGLKHFHVMSMLEDKKGNLWFGTIGGGVYRYAPPASFIRTQGKPLRTDGDFTLFTTTDGLADNAVLCMQEDQAGNIWFGTKAGVSCYDPSALLRQGGRTFTNFTTKDGLSDNFVCAIAQDKTGKLWFGTNGGVSCYLPSRDLFSNGKSLPANQSVFTNFNISIDQSFHLVRAILADKEGKVWIGCAEGLYCYNPSASSGSTLDRSSGNESKDLTQVTKNGIYFIFEDPAGNLWLSGGELNRTEMILFRFDARQAVPAQPEKSLTKIAYDKQVFGIARDRDGNIWYGTANGVCRYDPSIAVRKPNADAQAAITRFTKKVPE